MRYRFLCFMLFGLMLPAAAQKDPFFNAFKQGKENNCASIALIKVAMATYGMGGVYERVHSKDGKLTFKVKNGDMVALTQAQLDSAFAHTRFWMKDSSGVRIKEYADTCYAIMCAMHLKLDTVADFDKAVRSLSNGYRTEDVGKLLGLKLKKIRPHNPRRLRHMQHMIVYNVYHAAYASRGLYDESRKGKGSGVARIGRMRWHRIGVKNGFGVVGLLGVLCIDGPAEPSPVNAVH